MANLDEKNRIRGTLLGGAAGDALGYAIEFSNETTIFAKYGSAGITGYDYSLHSRKALISDDTQMTLFTACGLIDWLSGEYTDDPVRAIFTAYQEWLMTQKMSYRESAEYYHEFGERYSVKALLEHPLMFARRAPGTTCLCAVSERNVYEQRQYFTNVSLTSPINHSKGCGGVMRVAPIGTLNKSVLSIDSLAADVAKLTHSHSLGYMPAAVLAHIINRILYPQPGINTLKAIVEDARDTAVNLFRGDEHLCELTGIIDRAIALSENGSNDLDNIHLLGEGWVAEETLAIALYCSLKYQNDFSKGIIAAVNHQGDSDSTGAITGNILGAWVGYEAIDKKWKEDLELRPTIIQVADKLFHILEL